MGVGGSSFIEEIVFCFFFWPGWIFIVVWWALCCGPWGLSLVVA